MADHTAHAAERRASRAGDLRKLATVFKREFLERVRTRLFVVVTLLGPLFFALLTIAPAWMAMRERGSATVADVAILDATNTQLGARIQQALTDSGPGALRPVLQQVPPGGLPAAESAATAAVLRRARAGFLVLDSATLAGRSARYAGRNASSLADVDRIRDVVRREVLATRIERAGLPRERAAEITGPRLRLATTAVTDGGARGSGIGGVLVATITAVLLYMMILLYGQNVLRSVLEEKTTRVAEVVMASVKPDVLMAGKVFGVGAVGLVQQVVWVLGALFITSEVAPLLRAGRGGSAARAARQAAEAADATGAFAVPEIHAAVVASAVAFFFLGYLLYATFFAAAGAAVGSEQEAQQAALPVMMPLIATSLFIQSVIRNPESGAARFASWFPLSSPVIMPMRMALVGVGTGELLASVALLVLTCAGALWAAARIYRVGMLSYGQRASIGTMLRWVREAA